MSEKIIQLGHIDGVIGARVDVSDLTYELADHIEFQIGQDGLTIEVKDHHGQVWSSLVADYSELINYLTIHADFKFSADDFRTKMKVHREQGQV